MIEYFKLTSQHDKGTIVRANGAIQHEYVAGKGWVRSGVLLEYVA